MVENIEMFRSVYSPEISLEMSMQFVLSRPLDDIDLFIGYLKDHYPKLTVPFVRNLRLRLEESVKGVNFDIEVFETNPENLNDYPELESAYKKAVLQLLDYEKYSSKVTDGKAMFLFKDTLRSYLIPAAYIAETIAKLLSREKGLEFYRNYVDHRTDFEKRVQPKDRLEDIFDSLKEDESPLGVVMHLVIDGPLYLKVIDCLWKETLKEFDSEIGYAVACHYDFNATKHYNKNFFLTRPRTLMQGNGFCDFCWQDSRFITRDHPDDEFWKNLS